MKRILTVLAVAALMAVMLVAMAAPAFAAPGDPQSANGKPRNNPNAYNSGTSHAYYQTPANEPCISAFC